MWEGSPLKIQYRPHYHRIGLSVASLGLNRDLIITNFFPPWFSVHVLNPSSFERLVGLKSIDRLSTGSSVKLGYFFQHRSQNLLGLLISLF